jgi:archaetidylinositol phosphate synthase
MKKVFRGAKKKHDSITYKMEKRLVKRLVPTIPHWIKSYHLTLSTILWSAIIILSGYLSSFDIRWFWLSSFGILMHTITDALDGALGKYRKEGLVKWGYYMDHILDYIFLCSVLIGYSFYVSAHFKYMLFFVLAIFGVYLVNTYLTFPLTNRFVNSYLYVGATEIKLLFILLNTMLIFFSKTYMIRALPVVLIGSFIGIVIVIYRTQRKLWDIDKKNNIDRK